MLYTIYDNKSTPSPSSANLAMVLVLIVITFIICQTPGLIAQFDILPVEWFFNWLTVSNLLIVVNSAVNFLIYTAFGRKFRSVLLRVFRRCCSDSKKNAWTSYRNNTQVSNDYESVYQTQDTQYSSIRSNRSNTSLKNGAMNGDHGGKTNIQLKLLSKANNNDNNGVTNGMLDVKRSNISPVTEVDEEAGDDWPCERSPLNSVSEGEPDTTNTEGGE